MKKITLLSHMFTGNSLTFVFSTPAGVQSRTVESSHAQWNQVLAAFKAKNYDKVAELVDVATTLKRLSNGKFEVLDGAVYYDGEKAHGYLFDRIGFFMREGLDYGNLIKFAENLYKNPLKHVLEDLYKFLEKGHMPITADGCFLAYKAVQKDYYSVTAGSAIPLKGKRDSSGRIYNGVGETIEVERKDVNESRTACSSYGLHVGSYQYASTFHSGGHLLIVKVNPKDVVAVPTDGGKLRVVKYEVIAEEGRPLDEAKDANFDQRAKAKNAPQPDVDDIGSDGLQNIILTPAPKPLAPKLTPPVKVALAPAVPANKGWANKRDNKGRFFKKHNLG